MDRVLLVLCALLLNAALGGPKHWYAALGVARIGLLPARALRHFERKLNRDHRGTQEKEARGWILAAAAAAAGLVSGWLATLLLHDNLRFFELLLVAALLPVRPIWDRIAAVRAGLADDNLALARLNLAGTAWKHHGMLDAYGAARAAIETTSVEFSEKIVLPMLAYILLGLPGLFAARILTLTRDVAGAAPDFGKAARTAHGVLHYVPSRLSAAFWLLSPLFLPSGNIRETAARLLPGIIKDSPRLLNVRAASAVSKVSLGGPASPYAAPNWTDTGTLKPLPVDLRRAQAAFVFLNVFLFVFIGAFF